MNTTVFTASIVTYNTDYNELINVLRCLSTTIVDKIFVVDNSPSDSLRHIQTLFGKIEYEFGHGNVGYGAGHNIALKKAISRGSKYHLVINPDIYFEQETIEELLKYMDTNIDVAQIMPKVYYPNGELQYLCKKIPAPLDLIFKRFFPRLLMQNRIDDFQLKFSGYNKIMNIPYLSGCFMLFRVSALMEVGLFDERFFMYPEDIDITRRMHEKYKTIFYPEVSIVHAHAAESKISYRMLWVHIWNMIKYFNKWGWVFDKKRSFYNKRLMKDLM